MRSAPARPRFKPTRKYRSAVKIVKRLREAGFEAYLVGGCVRDLLMGRPPTDYDIATGARPEQVRHLFMKTVPVGAQFGVVLVLDGDDQFEVATFRTDQQYKDGRRPESVVFSTPEEDALRRDFTVNGLFFDPVGGRVIDYVDGRKDLAKKIVRAIGDPARRFEEDKLRVLRAVRFSATLGFAIERRTFEAVRNAAPKIQQVSAERVRDELVKLFTGPDPARGLELLDEAGLLNELLPEVEKTKGVQQPPEYHPEGDVYTHTGLVLKGLKKPSAVLAFSALLHDVGKPPTFKIADRIRFDGHDRVGAAMSERICRRLRFSGAETEAVAEIVRNHMKFKDVKQMRLSTLKRFMTMPTFEQQLELHRADCLASHGDLSNWRFLRRKLKQIAPRELKPPRLITGTDLLKAGYPEGPMIGMMLKAVEDQQLEGKLRSKSEAMAWVSETFQR